MNKARTVAFTALISTLAQSAAAALPTQPADERARQMLLPHSTDPIWTTLQKTKVTADEQKGVYLAANPPEVTALEGHDERITGFMLSLEVTPVFTHFLLTRYTPVCAFCPPGAPNEAVEVFTSQPVRYTSLPITVNGRFELQNNGAGGLFFRLTSAQVVRGNP